jgi:hypothetical protein
MASYGHLGTQKRSLGVQPCSMARNEVPGAPRRKGGKAVAVAVAQPIRSAAANAMLSSQCCAWVGMPQMARIESFAHLGLAPSRYYRDVYWKMKEEESWEIAAMISPGAKPRLGGLLPLVHRSGAFGRLPK